jgi:hypothetical protein
MAACLRGIARGCLIDLHNDRTFRDDRRLRIDVPGVFLNPVASDFQALIGTGLVRANSYLCTAITRIQQGIAYEARHFAKSRFDVGVAFFQKLK